MSAMADWPRVDHRPNHDSLNRRRRDRRQSAGKRITPQPRDLLWFQKLHQHGPLSSVYLHTFSRHIARSEKRARDRLTDLYNEDNTPHGGPYLDRPWQQFRTFDARYQPLVYDLAPAGEEALKQAGKWSEFAGAHTGPWQHRFMVSCITASIEIATLDNPSLNFIPQHAILERAGERLRYPVPFTDPKSGREVRSDLIPDALFGLEYLGGGRKSYRFFLVEADRATEPSRASKFNRKSHLRHFLQYREYVGRGLYKEHLKLTAGMLVLNVTSSERTMQSMLALLADIAPAGNTYQLFQAAPAFGRYFKPAASVMESVEQHWHRAGYGPLRIFDP